MSRGAAEAVLIRPCGVFVMWWLFALPLSAFLFWRWKTAGPSAAIGETILWSLLVPTWIVLPIGGLPLDVRSMVACLGLIAYCFHRDARFRTKLSVPDVAAMAMFGVHIFSDWINDGFSLGIPCRAYGEWIVPYLAGRVSVREEQDLRRLRSTACAVAMILAVWSTAESVGDVNPASFVVGARPTDQTPQHIERWGLKRAEGPTTHPIWFGMLQALLLPWTFAAASDAVGGRAPRWQAAALPCGAVGVFFSLSRGPWILFVLTLYGAAACRFTRARKALLITGAVAVACAVFAREPVLRGLQMLTSKTQPASTIAIENERVRHDETTHRLVLFQVYGEAMRRAGLIGFGTDRTSTFPVRVPLGVLDPKTMQQVWTIDNEYILLQLRFGVLGVLCLVVLLASAAAMAVCRGCRINDPTSTFFSALGSMLFAVLLILLVEWMPLEYGFILLWSAGAVSGFQAYRPVPHA